MKKQDKEMIRAEYKKEWNEHMTDYCTNQVVSFAILGNGEIWTIDKASIKKDFCFGYSLSRYDSEDFDRANDQAAHAETSVEYFINENLSHAGYDSSLNALNDKHKVWYVRPKYMGNTDCKIVSCSFLRRYDDDIPNDARLLTDDEKVLMVEALTEARNSFIKRLNTYLKKYGLSNINTWTYWRDA